MPLSAQGTPAQPQRLHPATEQQRKNLRQSKLVNFLYFIVGAIVTSFWAVIGFLIWIPLLTRMMLLFTAAILSAMLTGRDPTDAERRLEFAIIFYSRGFSLIRDCFNGSLHQSGPFNLPQPEHMGRVLVELLFCLFFWAGIFLTWKAFTSRLFG